MLEKRWVQARSRKGTLTDEQLENTKWNSKLAYMLSCTWCTGFWVSGVLSVILSLVYGFDYLAIVGWFAMATGVGLLGKIGDD